MKKVFLLASLACFGLQLTAQKNYYVTPAGSGDGSSWSSASTLQGAIEKVADGDIIHLSAGTFVPEKINPDTCTDMRMRSFTITRNIKLIGGYPATPTPGAVADHQVNKTIISGDFGNGENAYHLVLAAALKKEGQKIELNGITFTGGVADGAPKAIITLEDGTTKGFMCTKGAAVVAAGAALDLTNCVFTENFAKEDGGAVFYFESKGNIANCEFTGNETKGIGVLNCYTSLVHLSNSKFESNIASKAAGISVRGGSDVNIDNCNFTRNTATASSGLVGGAILVEQSSKLNVDRSTLSENKALIGAGIAVNGSKWNANSDFAKVVVSNTVIEKSNNNVTFQERDAENKVKTLYAAFGGAVYFDGGGTAGSVVSLENCTLDQNQAKEAGAIFADKAATLNMTGCVVSNNSVSCQFAAMKYNGVGTSGLLKECDIRSNIFFQIKEYNMMTVFAGSGAVLNIENSLIRDNKETEERKSAVAFGVRGGGTMNLVNTTVTGNSGRNLAYLDGNVDINGTKVYSSMNLISCTVIDNPECVQSEKLFHKDKTCFINAHNSIFANNLIKGIEQSDSFNDFKNSILGKKIHDAEGAVVPELEFDRQFMIFAELADKGGKTMVFELYPHEPEDDFPNYAVTHGMDAQALAALASKYGVSAETLNADQRGVARTGTYMGAYTDGIYSAMEDIKTEVARIYGAAGKIVVECDVQSNLEIYTISGAKVISRTVSEGKHIIELPSRNIYLVKAGAQTAKVVL